MRMSLMLLPAILTIVSPIKESKASVIHPRTNAPSEEKISRVTQESYENILKLKKEKLEFLKKKNAPYEQIKVVTDEIAAINQTIANIKNKISQTSKMFSPQKDPLQGQHVSLARMSQYNSVGSLLINGSTYCSGTIIGETNDKNYWIGLTAAHCVEAKKPSPSNLFLASDMSFCFKPLRNPIPGKESEACSNDEWIPAVGVVANADYLTPEDSPHSYQYHFPNNDMAFFMIPKDPKIAKEEINYPFLPTEKERPLLSYKMDKNSLVATGVGSGGNGNAVEVLQALFESLTKRAVSKDDIIKFISRGKGFKNSQLNYFKNAYQIPVYTYRKAKEIIGDPLKSVLKDHLFPADIIAISNPIKWEKGIVINEDSNIFSGAQRKGDSGQPIFVKNSEGKNIVIGVLNGGGAVLEVIGKDGARYIYNLFKEEIPYEKLQQCDAGNAKCNIYFHHSYSSFLDRFTHGWALTVISLLKEGPGVFNSSKRIDDLKILIKPLGMRGIKISAEQAIAECEANYHALKELGKKIDDIRKPSPFSINYKKRAQAYMNKELYQQNMEQFAKFTNEKIKIRQTYSSKDPNIASTVEDKIEIYRNECDRYSSMLQHNVSMALYGK